MNDLYTDIYAVWKRRVQAAPADAHKRAFQNLR
jgi:hypothetical protein